MISSPGPKVPKIPKKVLVKIVLWFNDTYTIRVFTKRRMTDRIRREWIIEGKEPDLINVLSEKREIYCDQLVQTLDDILG